MSDIPADAAPTTEEAVPPVPPGEPSFAAAAVSAAVAPGEDLLWIHACELLVHMNGSCAGDDDLGVLGLLRSAG